MLSCEVIGYICDEAGYVDIRGRKYLQFTVVHSEIKGRTGAPVGFDDESQSGDEVTEWVSVLRPGELGSDRHIVRGARVYVYGKLRTAPHERGSELRAGLRLLAREIYVISQPDTSQHDPSETPLRCERRRVVQPPRYDSQPVWSTADNKTDNKTDNNINIDNINVDNTSFPL